METWKPIPNWPEYEASNEGRIRAWCCQHGRLKEPYLLRQYSKDKYNHLNCALYRDGRWHIRAVGRLVLFAFTGPCSEGMECRHLDGNPKNNKIENLRWGTHKENFLDGVKHGTLHFGENHPNAVLNKELVRKIWELRLKGYGQKRTARILNRNRSAIREVLYGNTWLRESLEILPELT